MGQGTLKHRAQQGVVANQDGLQALDRSDLVSDLQCFGAALVDLRTGNYSTRTGNCSASISDRARPAIGPRIGYVDLWVVYP
jgi:hypothetical protein